jgi:hypothetical protein
MTDEGPRQESESEFEKGLVKESLAELKEFGNEASDSQIEKAVEHALRHEPQGERKDFLRRTIYRKIKDALRRAVIRKAEEERRADREDAYRDAGIWETYKESKDGEILPKD